MSNVLPPSTRTAAALPSPSPSCASDPHSNNHLAVVGIFFLFGVAALVPTIFFSQRVQATTSATMKAGRFLDVTLLDRALMSPSTFFALAMVAAGLLVWTLKLLPRGLSTSPMRLLGGTLIGLLLYPIGFAAILGVFFGINIVFWSVGSATSPGPHSDWFELLRCVPLALLLCAGGMFTVVLAALAIAFAIRCWPRRVLLWSFSLSAVTLFGTVIAAVIRQAIRFPTIPSWRFLVNSMPDILLFSLSWGVEFPILIGQPLLAALLGHWLYLAAREYAHSPA